MCFKSVIRVELRDSGAAIWNDAGFLTWLRIEGLDHEGNIGTHCKDTYLKPELDLH